MHHYLGGKAQPSGSGLNTQKRDIPQSQTPARRHLLIGCPAPRHCHRLFRPTETIYESSHATLNRASRSLSARWVARSSTYDGAGLGKGQPVSGQRLAIEADELACLIIGGSGGDGMCRAVSKLYRIVIDDR